jgi:diacylglycerol kinase family enzyme
VVIVANISAGSAGDVLTVLRERLPAAGVVEIVDGAALTGAVAAAARDAAVIGIVGGDGSVGTAAAYAYASDRRLLVVPGGTLNHLARDLGITGPDDAVAALQAGTTTALDVGLVDGDVFVNTVVLGSYPEVVDLREHLQDRLGKWPALVVALARVLPRARPVTVGIDGRPRRVWMVFVGNCHYQPPGSLPAWRERLDDGVLDVRVVDAEPRFSRARLALALVLGGAARSPVYQQWLAKEVRLRGTEGPMRLARDGETFDTGEEVVIRKAPRPLTVYAPAAG